MMATVAPHPDTERWLLDLYRQHYPDLVRLAVLLVDDHGLAEEIVQDVFVAASRHDAIEQPLPYLRRAVVNRARSTLRKRGVRRRYLRSVEAPPSAPPADAGLAATDDARRTMTAIGDLPDRQREVIVLRYWNDLSEAEIAHTLGISTGSVKTHAHRGLAQLARVLGDAPMEDGR